MKVTLEQATKIRDLIRDHGLVKGLGEPEPGKMCVEAVVCYALGLPHSDNPPCVEPTEVRRLKIGLNDRNWSSNEARAKGMAGFALAQLGSDVIKPKVFKDLWFFRFGTTQFADNLEWLVKEKGRSVKLLELAGKMRASKNIKECLAHAYAHAHAYAYAYTHGYAYGYAYAHAYAHAQNYDYGYAYDYDYDYAQNYDYDYGYSRDEYLTRIANLSVEVLKELKSPGCDFLHLVNQ